jgi:hypothetical protein
MLSLAGRNQIWFGRLSLRAMSVEIVCLSYSSRVQTKMENHEMKKGFVDKSFLSGKQ